MPQGQTRSAADKSGGGNRHISPMSSQPVTAITIPCA